MRHIFALVSRCNAYLSADANALLLKAAADYVRKMLGVFGLEERRVESAANAGPLLDVWCAFRTGVRKEAIRAKNTEILRLCDEVRDEALPKVGVRVEDDGKTQWKLGDPAEIQKAIEDRKRAAQAQARKKLENRKADLERKVKNFREWAKDPAEAVPELPAEASASQKKKHEKLRKAAEKNHATYLAEAAKDPEFLAKLEAQLQEVTAQLAN